MTTWAGGMSNATQAAYDRLIKPGASVIDALESGCNLCEFAGCDGSVGTRSDTTRARDTTPLGRNGASPLVILSL